MCGLGLLRFKRSLRMQPELISLMRMVAREWYSAGFQELLDEVLLKRKVSSVENASNETASLDEQEDALAKKNREYLAVMSTAGKCNDDPGGGVDSRATNNAACEGLEELLGNDGML